MTFEERDSIAHEMHEVEQHIIELQKIENKTVIEFERLDEFKRKLHQLRAIRG